MINLYWGSMYTLQTISPIIIYTTFLFENDNGNADNVYTRNEDQLKFYHPILL